MPNTQNIFFVGPMGAGKTTIGRRIAQHFGLDFIDLDDEIESRTGADVSLIFDIEGEQGFRKRETETLADVSNRQNIVLATGGGAVLAEQNRYYLASRGFVIYLKTKVEHQLQRLARDKRRPLLRAPNRDELLENMATVRNPLYESVADLIIISKPLSVKYMTQHVIRQIDHAQQKNDSH